MQSTIIIWAVCMCIHQIASLHVKGWGQRAYTNELKLCKRPLYDIGHEVLPNTQQWRIIPEILVFGLLGATIVIAIRKQATHIAQRFFKSHGYSMLLRAACFSFTLLPDASQMCEKSLYSGGCHDLIFSGHIIAMSLSVCAIVSMTTHSVMRLSSFFVAVITAITTISTRNHYTVDVILSLFVGPAMWTLIS